MALDQDDTAPVAVITGGEGDLALAIAAELAGAGFHVLAPGRSELDVTDSSRVSAWFKELAQLDLLVLNAGMTADAAVARLPESEWNLAQDVNLKGAFHCSRASLPLLRRSPAGHIVAIGSYSALDPPAGQSAYAASKAGLIGLMQSLAKEMGRRGIRANTILPGFLETKMTSGLPDAVIEAARQRHSLGRFNTPRDVGRFLVTLHQLEAVSGQVFQLDSRVRAWT